MTVVKTHKGRHALKLHQLTRSTDIGPTLQCRQIQKWVAVILSFADKLVACLLGSGKGRTWNPCVGCRSMLFAKVVLLAQLMGLSH